MFLKHKFALNRDMCVAIGAENGGAWGLEPTLKIAIRGRHNLLRKIDRAYSLKATLSI